MNIKELCDEVERLAAGPTTTEDHAEFCEYRRRMPPMEQDCHCGKFQYFREDLEDRAMDLVKAVRELRTG